MKRNFALVFLLILMLLLGVVTLYLQPAIERTKQEIKHLQEQIQAKEQQKEFLQTVQSLAEEVLLLRSENEDLRRQVEQWLETWDVIEAEVTSYAPLCATAVEGMCYSGDPSITAGGVRVVPGVTVAAGPSIPFGTRVWIEGFGFRTVQDRGGRITDSHLDIAVETRAEALAIGRSTALVVVER